MSDYLKKTISVYDDNPQDFVDYSIKIGPKQEIQKFLELVSRNSLILDAGCAFGRDSKVFSEGGLKVIGIDLSEGLLKKGKELYPQLDLRKMDMRKLDFADGTFDAIWAQASLVHLKEEDIKLVLKNFYKKLKTGGILLVSFKHGNGTGETHSKLFTYQTKNSLRELLNGAGFKILEIYNKQFQLKKEKKRWVYAFCRKP